MQGKTSIKTNFAYQMAYEILSFILPLITSPYISRVIGAEGLGIFSYSNSVAYYFVLFSMLGIKNYGSRVIAQERSDSSRLSVAFWSLNIVHIFFSAICFIVYLIYILFIGKELYALLQIPYVISALFDISWFYFGMEQFKLISVESAVIKIISLISIFIFVRTEHDVFSYCIIMSVCQLLSAAILWLPLKRYTHFVKPTINQMIVHIKPLFILFIPAIAVSLYKYMDKIMIGVVSDKVQLGYYENAEKVNSIAVTVISSFGTIMLPKMSNLAADGKSREMDRYIRLSMKCVMCIAMAMTFGVAVIGKSFAVLFWGNEFAFSGDLIIILSATIPFISFANVIRTQFLIPKGLDKEYMLSVMSGAVINLFLNYILIPKLGAKGAAIATVAAEVTVCVIQAFVVRKILEIIKYIKSSIPYFFIGIVMYLVIYSLAELMENKWYMIVIEVGLGSIIYIISCFIYFYIAKEDVYKEILVPYITKLINCRKNC